MRPFMRIANGVMLLFFLSWAAFQHNDPDALVWAAVYGAAALECVLFYLGRFPRPLGLAYIVLCALWSVYLAASIALAGEYIFDERGREMMGLFICAGWSYALYRSAAPRGSFSSA